MKILLLGSGGQLGRKIIETKPAAVSLIALSHTEADLSKLDALRSLIEKTDFDVLINAAAYTQVDHAETETELANLINGKAVELLAELCKKGNKTLIHISSDYVFSGRSDHPYLETDEVKPMNAYGASKSLGEKAIIAHDGQYFILRTSWLYGEYGKNFFRTIAGRIKDNSPVRVVSDQIGTPTYIGDLADVIWQLAPMKGKEIFHFANEGIASWFDFAKEIGRLLEKQALVTSISTADFPTQAKRPSYSVLDKTKIKKFLGLTIPDWKDGVKRCYSHYRKLENI